ncbi:hypothetical protein VNO77_30612 [Canavalia gladiata]|uniref:Uncharacterized protein n=1 Tax=Canavalia gladiata TaxID=3824 RepID=A0AAN9KRP6_CANGL
MGIDLGQFGAFDTWQINLRLARSLVISKTLGFLHPDPCFPHYWLFYLTLGNLYVIVVLEEVDGAKNASESPHAPSLGLAKFTHENRGYSPTISITWCTKLGSKMAPIQPQVALAVLSLSTEAYPYGFSHFLFTSST